MEKRSFVALRLQTVDPSGMRALSIAGGGRKRAKECIAAALGLGVVVEEEALHGKDHGVHAALDIGTDHVIIERVASRDSQKPRIRATNGTDRVIIERVASSVNASVSASSSGHGAFKKLACAVDLSVKIMM